MDLINFIDRFLLNGYFSDFSEKKIILGRQIELLRIWTDHVNRKGEISISFANGGKRLDHFDIGFKIATEIQYVSFF